MRFLRVLVIVVTLLLLMTACAQSVEEPASQKNSDGYGVITAEQLAKMLPAKDFTLVNVHIPYAGEIEKTDLLIPFDDIANQTAQIPEKNARIVVYCRSGPMSSQAAEDLVELGYTDVLDLEGGMNAWVAAGHELITR